MDIHISDFEDDDALIEDLYPNNDSGENDAANVFYKSGGSDGSLLPKSTLKRKNEMGAGLMSK